MARTAMPTFQRRAAELALLYWGGTTATGTLLGQVENFEVKDTISGDSVMRVGSSVENETFISKNVTWTLSVFEDADLQEIALIMGSTKPTAGGWVGTEDIALALTQSGVTVTVANYSAEATSATLLWTNTLTVVQVKEATSPLNAGETNLWSFSGRADTFIIEPIAGMGA